MLAISLRQVDLLFLLFAFHLQLDKQRSDSRGSFTSSMPSMGSIRFDNGFSDINSSGGGGFGGNSTGYGSSLDADAFKPKGLLTSCPLL